MEAKEALASLRKENGLTQDEMAERLFVTRQAVSRWENGNTTPNIDTLKTISKEFSVSINALLGDSQELVCQSCAMPMTQAEDLGTNTDGGANAEYCTHCFQNGGYTNNRTIDEMIESNLHSLDDFNKQTGSNYTEDEARTILKMHLATLKRWKDN